MGFFGKLADFTIYAGNIAELATLTEPLKTSPDHSLPEENIVRIDEILAEMGIRTNVKTIYYEIYLLIDRLDTASVGELTANDISDMMIHYSPRMIYAAIGSPVAFIELLQKGLFSALDKNYPQIAKMLLVSAKLAIHKATNSRQKVENWIASIDRHEMAGGDRAEFLDDYYDDFETAPNWYYAIWNNNPAQESETQEESDESVITHDEVKV